MKVSQAQLYKKYILNNTSAVFQGAVSSGLNFQKIMKNLIHGTSRSIFLACSGRENEGTEKWSGGKPLNRVNIRATAAGFFPDNPMDSIHINTYRDERELVFYVLADRSDAMYPRGLSMGIENPLTIKAVYSLYIQLCMAYLAENYQSKIRIIFYPEENIIPITCRVDYTLQNRLSEMLFSCPDTPPSSPNKALTYLIKKKVKHAVVIIISDEWAFSYDDKKSLLERAAAFGITNDIIYFPVCTDFEKVLGNAPGAVRAGNENSVRFLVSEKERNEYGLEINKELLAARSEIREYGIHSQSILQEKEDWFFDITDFFRSRLAVR